MGELLNQTLGEPQLTQIALPWSKGGLGLRSAYAHSCAAYLSSLGQCEEVVIKMSGSLTGNYITKSLSMLNSQLETNQSIPLAKILEMKEQSALSLMINEKLFNNLFSLADIDHKAKLMCITADQASNWLSMIPDPHKGLAYSNSEFSKLLRFWIHLDVYPENSKCPLFSCGAKLDEKGTHALSCKSSPDRITKHNNIRDVIFREAEAGAKNPRLEVAAIFGQDNMRPADIFLPFHAHNRSSCLDVGIVNPLTKSYVISAAKESLSAAKRYDETKTKKYSEKCNKESTNYFAICGEVTGGWTPTAHRIFKELYTASARRYNIKVHVQKKKFYDLLSFHLQKMNATMLLRRDKVLI
jgi:hypothetical protein